MSKKRISKLQTLAAAIDGRLREFSEIPLKDEDDGCCIGMSGPTLYISGRKNPAIFDLPGAGEAVIRYRLRNKSVNFREDGTERYSTDIEVQSIEPMPPGEDDDDGGVSLEAILAKYDFADGRQRDDGGRFAPGYSAGAPEMAKAYGMDEDARRKRRLVAAGALAAGATAAGGAMALRGRGSAGRITQGVTRVLMRR